MRPPSLANLSRVTATQAQRDLTYAEPGATRGMMPAGYRHDQWEADLGRFDEATFNRLSAALWDWQVQRGAGISVYPAGPVRPARTFAFWFRLAGV
jgi:uncharacterized protein (UPF0548 family)